MQTSSLVLNFDDFNALRQLIYEHCGIWLGDSKVIFLRVRLADRLRARNISSAQEYYYFLKYDSQGNQEMQQLIDAVTVNETWFFRETGPVDAWYNLVLPGLKLNQRLRMWSAGCATGEEPYTLAMLLLELYPTARAGQFDILATDISQRALAIARTGVYDPYSLRRTDPRMTAKYFQPTSDGRYTVRKDVQQMVRFDHANLIDPALARRIQAMDAVICRNVIIYLDAQSRQAVLANLYAALKPGGHLLLGHSESLLHVVTPFEVARVAGKIMYRKGKS